MSRLKKRFGFVISQQGGGKPACPFRESKTIRKSAQRIFIYVECPDDPSIQFVFFTKLNPIVAGSHFFIGYAIRRLRSHTDFKFWVPVVFALGLTNQDCTMRVP